MLEHLAANNLGGPSIGNRQRTAVGDIALKGRMVGQRRNSGGGLFHPSRIGVNQQNPGTLPGAELCVAAQAAADIGHDIPLPYREARKQFFGILVEPAA
jgi:hypothetical protein